VRNGLPVPRAAPIPYSKGRHADAPVSTDDYFRPDAALNDLLETLTAAQREAATHRDGPLLILAGPGSGKTRVVTHRIAWLLREGVRASRILALTFTNKAAEEMRGRVAALAPGETVWTSTFHRFCARLLRQHAALVGLEPNFAIYDAGDSRTALRRVMASLLPDDSRFTPEQIASAISWAKNNLITAAQYQPRLGSPLGAVVAQVYPQYQARLLKLNAVDFDDLLLHVATLLREQPEVRAQLDDRYRYVMVDEYQDTNLAQYSIVRALSIDHPNLAVTGDPDQSIYGWRGANLSNILDFEKDYPDVRVVRLERNYRSTQRILRVADELISRNVRRKVKRLYTENDEGPPVRLVRYATQQSEAESIAARIAADIHADRRRPRDFAVFYRTNALSRALEFALRDAGVPYQMINGVEFYQRQEIKDVLSYLAVLNNPRDDVALERIINTPARGIGKATVERLREHARGRGGTLLEAARESGVVAGLAGRSAVAVARFVALIDRLGLLAGKPVEEIIGHVLADSGYQEMLKASTVTEDQDRLANIEELLTAAREFDERNPGDNRLEEFLEQACLVNETDDWEAAGDRVTLMTLHASKGLEFPVVFVIALEEGLLPHERSREHPEQLEEERRLLFVGMTRAQRELQLSMARYRHFRGRQGMTVPSQFLMELPRDEMECQEESWTPPSGGMHKDYDPTSEHPHEWAQDVPTVDDGRGAAGTIATDARPRLTTAAEMAEQPLALRAAATVDQFHQGMVVLHAEYGPGKIVALSGSGSRRCATVRFPTISDEKKFVLASGALRPAAGPPATSGQGTR
jgi:DNA helicase II / ATP-dependent DNA helicase PcrA